MRLKVDQLSDALNGLLAKARDAALRAKPTAKPAAVRPLIAELAGLMNGTAEETDQGLNPQAAIDAMFAK